MRVLAALVVASLWAPAPARAQTLADSPVRPAAMADLTPTRAIGLDAWLSTARDSHTSATVVRTDLTGEWAVAPWLELHGRLPVAAAFLQFDEFVSDDGGLVLGSPMAGARTLLQPDGPLVVGLGAAAVLPTSAGDDDQRTALRLHHLGHQPYVSAGWPEDDYNGQRGSDLIGEDVVVATTASVAWQRGRRLAQLEIAAYTAFSGDGPQLEALRASTGGTLRIDDCLDFIGELTLLIPRTGERVLPGFDAGIGRRTRSGSVAFRYHLAIGTDQESYWHKRVFLGAFGLSLWWQLGGP